MSLPFKSLDAVTTTGAGTSYDLEEVRADHMLHVIATGGPTRTCDLEGSLNGTNWFMLSSTNSGYSTTVAIGDYPVRYVRANLTVLSGGSSPTVTARIASA